MDPTGSDVMPNTEASGPTALWPVIHRATGGSSHFVLFCQTLGFIYSRQLFGEGFIIPLKCCHKNLQFAFDIKLDCARNIISVRQQ